MRIAILEDEPHLQELYLQIATLEGHEVPFAGDGRAAVAWPGWADVDLAVIDYAMPGVDGLEVARFLQAHYPHVRLVLCTAMPITRSMRAVVPVVVQKPFSMVTLIGALDGREPD